jgi:hypothetical protein
MLISSPSMVMFCFNLKNHKRFNAEKMLIGVYVKVLIKPRYVVTEQKWKNTCCSIKVVHDINDITKHNLEVIKCYLERKDGFVHRIKS